MLLQATTIFVVQKANKFDTSLRMKLYVFVTFLFVKCELQHNGKSKLFCFEVFVIFQLVVKCRIQTAN